MSNEQKVYPELAEGAWVVAVNMGYGHQRTAYPLKNFAFGRKVINANSYKGIPEKDKKIWESSRKFYEFISRFKRVPLIGEIAFSFYDKFQKIPSFYPKRDLSKPTFSLKKIFSLIEKRWGRDLISKLKEKPLPPHQTRTGAGGAKFDEVSPRYGVEARPLITTFFVPAFMAEVFDYPGDIFCVICDADISRTWVSLNPQESRIKYFAPNTWVVDRLELYGVKEENIFLTGYPLPIKNVGREKLEILREDLGYRILNLDPQRKYCEKYRPLIDKYIGVLPKNSDHPLTIMFSIGGAGAQKEITIKFLESLAKKIKEGEIKVILSAGIREAVKEYFLENIKKLGLADGKVEIVFAKNIEDYFQIFNQKLRKTDILWTKPSELSFYTGLGLPIIIAPSIGSQEDFNRRWLLRIGAGILQKNPKYANQWLFDYLDSGRFAEAAMEGFLKAEKLGTYNIQKICFGQ